MEGHWFPLFLIEHNGTISDSKILVVVIILSPVLIEKCSDKSLYSRVKMRQVRSFCSQIQFPRVPSDRTTCSFYCDKQMWVTNNIFFCIKIILGTLSLFRIGNKQPLPTQNRKHKQLHKSLNKEGHAFALLKKVLRCQNNLLVP